jgi:hypothetical protein
MRNRMINKGIILATKSLHKISGGKHHVGILLCPERQTRMAVSCFSITWQVGIHVSMAEHGNSQVADYAING